MKKILIFILVVISLLIFFPDKQNISYAYDDNDTILVDNDFIFVYKDDIEIFRINILELSLYQSEIDGNFLYSLWVDDFSLKEINIDKFSIINISFHNAFDEIPRNIYEEDLYLKIIYHNDEFEYFYEISKVDNFNLKYFDNYKVYLGIEFYEKAYLDYSMNLRTINIAPFNNVEYFNHKQTLDSNFDINNYLENFVINSSDDNLIVNLIPKTYFTQTCEMGQMGEAFGYYIKTSIAESNYGGYCYVSEVLLFKTTNFTDYQEGTDYGNKILDFQNIISPVLNCCFCTYRYDASIWKSYRLNPLKRCDCTI